MATCTLGIAATSYLSVWQTQDTLEFLERCHGFRAAGIHAVINGDPLQIRRRAEALDMYFEAMVPLPSGDDATEFEQSLKAAQTAGATALRAACLGSRRYETFQSLETWQAHVAASYRSLETALPLLEKYKIPLGLENHKDWTSDELLSIMKRFSSEYFGVCLDFGNNIALMDIPMEAIKKLAPYTVTTHLKDISVAPHDDGITLSEVVLGQGIIDLRDAVQTIRAARPQVRMNLEMITRSPLLVPMGTERYRSTFEGWSQARLDSAVRYVAEHQTAVCTSASEDGNIEDCIEAWQRLEL